MNISLARQCAALQRTSGQGLQRPTGFMKEPGAVKYGKGEMEARKRGAGCTGAG